jgi:hypothetical protein
MIENLIIRRATADDIDFIIKTIIESDKSSTDVISACNIFSLSESEYKEVLRNILTESIGNNEYDINGYLIAELQNRKLGALASWFEGLGGISNSVIKSNLLFSFIDREKLIKNKDRMHLVNALTLNREQNTIQLEYAFVVEDKRRQKIFTKLIIESIRKHFNFGYKSNVQAMLYPNNYKSYNAFEKLGFKVKTEKKSDDPEIRNIFAYNSKVLMELDRDSAEKLIETPLELISINNSTNI